MVLKRIFITDNRWRLVVNGLWVTLLITILSLLFGCVLGAGICYMRMSKHKVLSVIAKAYIEMFRDLPILVILLLMFYVVFASSGINSVWVAVITFSLNMAAYTSEIFRSGIQSIDRGQTEAGLAMGFSSVQTLFSSLSPKPFSASFLYSKARLCLC